MKILLTGATGFVGSHVARKLVAEGFDIYALIRPRSNTWRINDVLHSLGIVPCDLFSATELDAFLDQIRPDVCVHLAWYTEPGKYWNSLENLNFLSTSLHLAIRLANLNCKRFIGIGTCAEYDTALGYLSEASATAPSGLYSASKLSLFLALEQLGKVTGMAVAWLRMFYLYGPCENERRMIPHVISSLLRNSRAQVTKGDQIRDYLHVEDAAAAIVSIAQSKLVGPINIGSGKPVTVREIVARIGDILNRPGLIDWGVLPYSDFDPMFICANNARLRENTNWAPRYNLDQGLHQTIEWWRARLESLRIL